MYDRKHIHGWCTKMCHADQVRCKHTYDHRWPFVKMRINTITQTWASQSPVPIAHTSHPIHVVCKYAQTKAVWWLRQACTACEDPPRQSHYTMHGIIGANCSFIWSAYSFTFLPLLWFVKFIYTMVLAWKHRWAQLVHQMNGLECYCI